MTAATPVHSPFIPALRLSARHAHAINALIRRTARFNATLGEPGINWQCSLIASGTRRPPAQSDIFLQLEWDSAPLIIQVSVQTLQAWLESQMPGLQFSRLPHAVATAALDVWINQVLKAFHNRHASVIRIVRHTTDPDTINALPLVWSFTMRSSDTQPLIQGTLHSDTTALDKLTALTKNLPQVPGPVDVYALTVDARVLIGHTSLPASMISTLQHGDVVMLDQCLVGTDGQFWLALGKSVGIRIKPEQGRYTVTQGWTPLMTESEANVHDQDGMPENTVSPTGQHDDTASATDTDTDAENTPDPLSSLDQVSINLSFDLGQRRLSLSELQALQPGELFDLARPLNDGPVHIRANGTLIGHGELVDIDGSIGVQVSRLGPK